DISAGHAIVEATIDGAHRQLPTSAERTVHGTMPVVELDRRVKVGNAFGERDGDGVATLSRVEVECESLAEPGRIPGAGRRRNRFGCRGGVGHWTHSLAGGLGWRIAKHENGRIPL